MLRSIPVHGTPITPRRLLRQMAGESFCVSYADPRDIETVLQLQDPDGILVLDNGAFTHWKTGRGQIDVHAFWRWANELQARHLAAVAVIPDVIGGSEAENQALADFSRLGAAEFPHRIMYIWHLNESLELLERNAQRFNFVGFGSCAEYDVQTNRAGYARRLAEAREVLAGVEHYPWVHLMRGLGQLHAQAWANSADSTNVARNHCRTKHQPEHVAAMCARIRDKIDAAGALAVPPLMLPAWRYA